MEHAQLTKFAAKTSKNLMMETNFWMAETNSTRDYFTSQIGFVRDKIKLAQDSFKREIEYVSAKLDTERTDIKIMKDSNQTKFDSIDSTSWYRVT